MTQDEIRDNVHQVLHAVADAFGEHMPSVVEGMPGATLLQSDLVQRKIDEIADAVADVAANGTQGVTHAALMEKARAYAQAASVQEALKRATDPYNCFGPDAFMQERLAALGKLRGPWGKSDN